MRRRHLSEAELTECIDGELRPRKAAAAEEHLRRCNTCASAAAALRGAAAAVGSLKTLAVPADLRARVAQRLARDLAAEITCRQAAPLIHQHIDRYLSPEAELQLQGHLESCARCRAEVAALSSAAHLVRSLPTVQGPVRIREAVIDAQRVRRVLLPWNIRWRPAAAAAVALAAAAALVLLWPAGRQVPSPAPHLVGEREAAPSSRSTEVASLVETPVAEQPAAPVADDVGTAAPEPAPQRPAERPAPPSETAVTAAGAVKGPAPARTTPASPEPEIELPSALQALRTVAANASHDLEGRRALELAGERFATIHSESLWARLPSAPALRTESDGPAGAEPRVAPAGADESPEEIGGLEGTPSPAPEVRRLVGVSAPLV